MQLRNWTVSCLDVIAVDSGERQEAAIVNELEA